MLDGDTEVTDTTAMEGVFIYNYRLVNHRANEVRASTLIATARPAIAKQVCDRPETRDRFLRKGIALRYVYSDRDRRPIASFDVTEHDCRS
jgi:hypothetical protein